MRNLKLSAPKERNTPVDDSFDQIQFKTNECYRAINVMASEPDAQEINRAFLSKLGCKQVCRTILG